MRKAFQMFDTQKTGFIETIKISTILNTMGQLFDDNELNALIDENDPDGEFKWPWMIWFDQRFVSWMK